MGVVEEIMKNKEGIVLKFLEVMSGKETSATVNLDGMKFNIGEATIKLDGEIKFTLVPPKKK